MAIGIVSVILSQFVRIGHGYGFFSAHPGRINQHRQIVGHAIGDGAVLLVALVGAVGYHVGPNGIVVPPEPHVGVRGHVLEIDQNLNLLLAEMSSSQEQISTAVTPRITNLLAPVVDMVIEKTVTYKEERTITTNGSTDQDQKPRVVEVKENHFTRKVVDPAFLSLCHKILARNAPMLRRVVLSNFHKILAAIKDFLKAQKNDQQHSRSFTY